MRIQPLSPLVASQIAAGEVIERPASVLKELLENSIDSNSNAIIVEIEQGGLKLIKIRDNGNGIYKDDLSLALQQHATSKIRSVEDLAEITSLGFRGEALASIAAVSQLELISKPKEQEFAWEFKMHENILQPASHTDGTTVIVKNLFYNVPARRKFLRSEYSEFNYLEDLFKRMVLSQFTIAFSLVHNGKKLRYLPACSGELAKAKRLATLCGNRMLEQSMYLDAEQNGLRLWGWLGMPADARSNSSNQFFYINQRMVKDKLINHAIKQAYQAFCPPGKYPTYCLYFELDVKALDVNVHPTKHEVRFRDARIIHAFLTKVIEGLLTRKDQPITILPNELHTANSTLSNHDQYININSENICTPTLVSLAAKLEPTYNSIPLKMENNALKTIIPTAEYANHEDYTLTYGDETHACKEVSNNIVGNNKKIINCDKANSSLDYQQQTKILCIIGNNKLILAEQAEKILLVDVKTSTDKLLTHSLEKLFLAQGYIPSQPLLMPKVISIAKEKDLADVIYFTKLFIELGFNIDRAGVKEIMFRTVPLPLKGLEINYAIVTSELIKLFKELKLIIPKHLNDQSFNETQATNFVSKDYNANSNTEPADLNAKVIPSCTLLSNIAFTQSIKVLLANVMYQEQLSIQDAENLVLDIISFPIQQREKPPYKKFDLQELYGAIYT